MSDRKIGHVVSVDSFRVVIELDGDLKSLFKSGYDNIYDIARINSYVILPVGSEKIVAYITRVKVQDETELNSSSSSGIITLPESKRLIVATMIGTITSDKEYVQGVYNFPILDNPVWYVKTEDLDQIFDQEDKETIDFDEDYFLPIGVPPAFPDYQIKINPDQLFGKHAAILGNTGSGKSCTIASILQSIFKWENNDQKINSANVIIFDTNGEYEKAFDFENSELNERVNALNISENGLKVPYWFMNYDDFDYLFQPAEGSQAPVLKRALVKAKDQRSDVKQGIPKAFRAELDNLIELIEVYNKNELNKAVYFSIEELHDYFEENHPDLGIHDVLSLLVAEKSKLSYNEPWVNGIISPSIRQEVLDRLKPILRGLDNETDGSSVSKENDADLPIYFDFKDLFEECIDEAIEELETSSSRIREYVTTLILRIRSYYYDDRISIPFLLKSDKIEKALPTFLAFLTGIFTKAIKDTNNIYSEYLKEEDKEGVPKNVVKKDSDSQVAIIDLSLLPYEVLENVTGLIGRLILEFLQRLIKVPDYQNKRGDFPIVLVLEEAQNYIPEQDRKEDRVSISKRVFERIAREGRKYGLSLVIASQRPSELSRTILSQCNSYIIHRLQNPGDQSYVKKLVSSANEDILNQLPVLPQQHAVITGDAVRSPVQIKINDVNPQPDSDDPEFFAKWIQEPEQDLDKKFPDFEKVVNEWINKSNNQNEE